MGTIKGRLAWSAQYRAYGQLALADVQTTDNNLRFQGQYFDSETGLHYNLNRHYDPSTGRFIHQDPIGLAGGENLYEYAPNPVNWVDPWGWMAKYANSGRAGRQAKLRSLVDDDKLGTSDRGWIRQEINSIDRGKRSSIRNPPGKDLAHMRGREAAKGFDYSHSNLQDRDLHRIQHRYDNFGRSNRKRDIP